MSSGWNGIGSMDQIFDHSTVQRSSAAKRSLASRASRSMLASTPASRSRMSSVASQRPTTEVTMPGKVFTLPMVATELRMLAGDGADFERELRAGGERVAANLHGRGAGVRLLAVEGDGPALDTFGAQHDAERLA